MFTFFNKKGKNLDNNISEPDSVREKMFRENSKQISVYIDGKDTLYAIPSSYSYKIHNPISSSILCTLSAPYTVEELEQFLLGTLDLSFTKPIDDNDKKTALEKYLGINGWSKAIHGMKNISVSWSTQEGYSVTPMAFISAREGYGGLKVDGNRYGKRYENVAKNELARTFLTAMEESIPCPK